VSVEVIRQGEMLKVISSSEPIREGERLRLFTLEELRQRELEAAWGQLSSSSRDTMLMQTQSKAYEDWMAEDEWTEEGVRERIPTPLSLKDFRP